MEGEEDPGVLVVGNGLRALLRCREAVERGKKVILAVNGEDHSLQPGAGTEEFAERCRFSIACRRAQSLGLPNGGERSLHFPQGLLAEELTAASLATMEVIPGLPLEVRDLSPSEWSLATALSGKLGLGLKVGLEEEPKHFVSGRHFSLSRSAVLSLLERLKGNSLFSSLTGCKLISVEEGANEAILDVEGTVKRVRIAELLLETNPLSAAYIAVHARRLEDVSVTVPWVSTFFFMVPSELGGCLLTAVLPRYNLVISDAGHCTCNVFAGPDSTLLEVKLVDREPRTRVEIVARSRGYRALPSQSDIQDVLEVARKVASALGSVASACGAKPSSGAGMPLCDIPSMIRMWDRPWVWSWPLFPSGRK